MKQGDLLRRDSLCWHHKVVVPMDLFHSKCSRQKKNHSQIRKNWLETTGLSSIGYYYQRIALLGQRAADFKQTKQTINNVPSTPSPDVAPFWLTPLHCPRKPQYTLTPSWYHQQNSAFRWTNLAKLPSQVPLKELELPDSLIGSWHIYMGLWERNCLRSSGSTADSELLGAWKRLRYHIHSHSDILMRIHSHKNVSAGAPWSGMISRALHEVSKKYLFNENNAESWCSWMLIWFSWPSSWKIPAVHNFLSDYNINNVHGSPYTTCT